MSRGKRYQPEQVVNLLRQIEVSVANGKTAAQACKEAEIAEQTYFRWRKEYGGLQIDQAKRRVIDSWWDTPKSRQHTQRSE
jgi:putative transposase